MKIAIDNNIVIAKRICYIFLSVLLIVFLIVYVYKMNYALDTLEILDEKKWRTITIYISGIVGFAILFLILNLVVYGIGIFFVKHKKVARLLTEVCTIKLAKKLQLFVVVFLSVIGSGFLLHYFFYQQKRDVGFNLGCFCLPDSVWGFSIAIMSFYVAYMIKRKTDISNVAKYLVFATTLMIVFATTFITNPFAHSDGVNGYANQFINFNIAWESIYNIIDGVPYTYDTTPIYGHYALFFLPLRYVGNRYTIVAISFAFSVAVALGQAATLYIINTFSKKNWMAVLLALGSIARTEYYEVHQIPIRTIFPTLLCALVTFLFKKGIRLIETRKYYLVFFISLMLSIICNLEMGVVCVLSFITYVIFELLYYSRHIKDWVINLFFAGVVSVAAFAGSILIVNIYNFLNGGPVVIKAFFFPMTGTDISIVEYIQDHFVWPVPLGNTAWIHILAFLLAVICTIWYISVATKMEDKNKNSVLPILGSMVCMVIFSFTYYMNEPLWTDLANYTAILFGIYAIVFDCLLFVLENDFQEIGYQAVRVAVILVSVNILCGAVQVINDPIRIAARELSGAYDLNELNNQIAAIDIPSSTYGFGQGVTMIYHRLGWENRMKYRDTSELDLPRSETLNVAVNDLKQQDFVFTGVSSNFDIELIEKLQERGFSFEPQKTFRIGDYDYCYFRVVYSE